MLQLFNFPSKRAARDDMQPNECDGVTVKLHLQKQVIGLIWPVGPWLLTFVAVDPSSLPVRECDAHLSLLLLG